MLTAHEKQRLGMLSDTDYKVLNGLAVNVTAEHITHGRRMDCDKCPIAVASQDAFKQCEGKLSFIPTIIEVDGHDICVDSPPDNVNGYRQHLTIQLCEDLEDFILDFDSQNEVKPVSFRILHDGSRTKGRAWHTKIEASDDN